MRVLVTGGLGFIGSRLCGALLDEGMRVRCVDRRCGPAAHPRHVRGMDAVIHLAALPGVRTRHAPALLHGTNVELTDRLAAAAARERARFVFVSSSSVYGNAELLPTPEHAPLAPLNPYAASKVAAERAVLARAGDPVIVRPFTVYGPGQRPEMAFARWITALDSGRPLPWRAAPGAARDFTYVDDAVTGLIAALVRGRAGEAYNVSGWHPVPLLSALRMLGADVDELHELPPSPAEALVTSGCGRKARADLGYAPRVEIADGLDRQRAAATSPSLAA